FARSRKVLVGAAVAAMLAAATPAAAQGLALGRFDPAPAGDRFFGVPSPYAAGSPAIHLMLLGDYAHNPLVLKTVPSNDKIGAVVKNQFFLHLNGGVALWNRLLLHADLPVIFENGDSPTGEGQPFTSPGGAKIGDLRLGFRVRLFGEYHDPFQIAVG